MDIDAHVRSNAKLEDYFFIVPDYQRKYVWKPDDQVEQFIIDIANEFDPNAPEQNSYFLGSIRATKILMDLAMDTWKINENRLDH